MLVSIVDLRINGFTVYFVLQFKLQKTGRSTWLGYRCQTALCYVWKLFGIQIDEHRLQVWGPKTMGTEFKVLTMWHVLENLI
jgi:hypothetical protein